MPLESVQHVFSLPPRERYVLAQQLLDSIDDRAGSEMDQEFSAELRRRRDEMLRGEETIVDWRAAISAIESSLPAENRA